MKQRKSTLTQEIRAGTVTFLTVRLLLSTSSNTYTRCMWMRMLMVMHMHIMMTM